MKKVLSILLSCIMIFGICSSLVYAEGGVSISYVVCDGNNDAAKINSVLGENTGVDAGKRVIYLMGNCVLNAADLIEISGDAVKHVIKPCSNVVFDGTYCDSLTWDGSVAVDSAVTYRIFDFKEGVCGLRNMTIKYINTTEVMNLPEFAIQQAENMPDAEFTLDNLKLYDVYFRSDTKSKYALYSNAGVSRISNNEFYRLTSYCTGDSDMTDNSNMCFSGKCGFYDNSFYEINDTSDEVQGNFLLTGSKSSIISNCFDNARGNKPIVISSGTQSTIQNNKISKCQCSIELWGGARSNISGNVFSLSTLNGGAILGEDAATVADNLFYRCTFMGTHSSAILLYSGQAKDNLFNACMIPEDGDTVMIYVADGAGISLTGNYIELTTTDRTPVPDTYTPYECYSGDSVIMGNYANTSIFGKVECNESTSVIANNYPSVSTAQ